MLAWPINLLHVVSNGRENTAVDALFENGALVFGPPKAVIICIFNHHNSWAPKDRSRPVCSLARVAYVCSRQIVQDFGAE